MITESMLDALRERISHEMSPYRFRHTAEVERMVIRLAELYAPHSSMMLRAAALLHDVTKECDREEQLALCERYGIALTAADIAAPATLHAMTAAKVIPERYPEFAAEELLFAVRWHTTGCEDMTTEAWLLYLADLIDLSRTFEHCVTLREFFWSADPASMSPADRQAHLRATLIRSLDQTVASLLKEGRLISEDSIRARNRLLICP